MARNIMLPGEVKFTAKLKKLQKEDFLAYIKEYQKQFFENIENKVVFVDGYH